MTRAVRAVIVLIIALLSLKCVYASISGHNAQGTLRPYKEFVKNSQRHFAQLPLGDSYRRRCARDSSDSCTEVHAMWSRPAPITPSRSSLSLPGLDWELTAFHHRAMGQTR